MKYIWEASDIAPGLAVCTDDGQLKATILEARGATSYEQGKPIVDTTIKPRYVLLDPIYNFYAPMDTSQAMAEYLTQNNYRLRKEPRTNL